MNHHTIRAVRAEGAQHGLSLLFLAACPLFLWYLSGSVQSMFEASMLLALLAFALWLVAEGCRHQAAYDVAEVALRPRLPRKLMGATLIGLLAMILAGAHFAQILHAAACGAMATGLCLVAFGIDPLRNKGTDDPACILRQRALALTDTVETRLNDMVLRIDGLEDAELSRRTHAVRCAVTRMARALARNPEALRPLSRPLLRFLDLALKEADRLQDCWGTDDRAFARRRYIAKLAVMTEMFETRVRRHSKQAGRDGYELEADLLLDRMVRETAA